MGDRITYHGDAGERRRAPFRSDRRRWTSLHVHAVGQIGGMRSCPSQYLLPHGINHQWAHAVKTKRIASSHRGASVQCIACLRALSGHYAVYHKMNNDAPGTWAATGG